MENFKETAIEFAKTSRLAAAEGAVLLRNDQNNLPLVKGDNVAVFGRVQLDWYRCGTGSGGSVNVAYKTNLLDSLRAQEGIEVNEQLASVYDNWIKENPANHGDGSWASEPWFQQEMPLSDEIVTKAWQNVNKALLVIGRTAGEDQDNKDEPGSFRLTASEKSMLTTVCKAFKRVIVILNVSNIIDMSWLKTDISQENDLSVIYVWQGGMEGGNAAADILVGDVVPSGKLTDTIAESLEDHPAAANYDDDISNFYQEDVYVGYRYFETFSPEKVLFEFGYGLSYTEFDSVFSKGRINEDVDGPYIEFDVTVTNVGETYSGKEVIQLYYAAPQGKLGKPTRVLGAFVKTDSLEPGKKEKIKLILPIREMASYDDSGVTGNRSCYVLEPGAYKFYIGNSVRNAKLAVLDNGDSYEVTEVVVIEQLEEVMAPKEAFLRMKPGKFQDNQVYELTYENTPQRMTTIADRITSRLPENLVQTGDKGYKLKDVADGKITMEDFIAQLSDHDLMTIVRGEGMGSPWVTQGTASAFGALSESLRDFGIPIGCTADGPSGIRMEGGHHATQIPIGACLAASWNLPLVETLFQYEGNEMLINDIDVLLGPGMNIKRHPLNGRNFEYFSEDPLITGKFASATVKGIAKSGCHATLKHFVCNNQERVRKMINAEVSERALREIYLKGFEIAVKEGKATSIMTAYNPINGQWSASNYDLNTTVLRKEWGFDGIAMTDWWATMNDPVKGGEAKEAYTNHMIRSQNDVYMVVNNFGAEVNLNNDNLEVSLADGSLTKGELQRSAMNICHFLMTTPSFAKAGKIKERVTDFEPLSPQLEGYNDIVKTPELMIDLDGRNVFCTSEPGTYRIVASIINDASGIAQAECNLLLNGRLMSLIQTNGTGGKLVERKLNKIRLDQGFYELDIELLKSGLVVKSLTFIRE